MDRLFEKYYKKLDRVPMGFQRGLLAKIDFSNRLVGIKGARGAGKTTLLLQYAKKQLPPEQSLYVSLDDLYFADNKLAHLAEDFVKRGGKYLLLDEVHRYPGWSQELKNIYDDEPELSIVFTGSSIIHLDRAKGDLSRRAVMYELFGMSFREYLHFVSGTRHETITIKELLTDHVDIARRITKDIKPLEHFSRYLKYGYYPYFMENTEMYHQKLEETVSLALSADLPALHDITPASIEKIRLLLYIIAESVPFKPNISKLSERTGVTRNTLVTFLRHLDDLRIIRSLYHSVKGIGLLQKPEKIFMHHPNLHYALAQDGINTGNIRESFFINQMGAVNDITYSEEGDFKVNKNVFEIGGKDKTNRQIKHLQNSYVAADGIEIGHANKIPLWLFGFLY